MVKRNGDNINATKIASDVRAQALQYKIVHFSVEQKGPVRNQGVMR